MSLQKESKKEAYREYKRQLESWEKKLEKHEEKVQDEGDSQPSAEKGKPHHKSALQNH